MHQPMFVRALSPVEERELESGLKSRDGFVLRRSQILLASSRGERVKGIAAAVGCSRQTVRNVIRAFGAGGTGALGRRSSRPKTVVPELGEAKRERLKEVLHQSPRVFGKPRSTWTLELLAAVAHERGLTEGKVSSDTIRVAIRRLGVGWKRAKKWITSPDPLYGQKKAAGPADPGGGDAHRLRARVPGRGVVEPPGPARPARLVPRREPAAADRAQGG
jgi:transposase